MTFVPPREKMRNSIGCSITYDREVYEWVEATRGDVKRATFVNRVLRNEMDKQRKTKR